MTPFIKINYFCHYMTLTSTKILLLKVVLFSYLSSAIYPSTPSPHKSVSFACSGDDDVRHDGRGSEVWADDSNGEDEGEMADRLASLLSELRKKVPTRSNIVRKVGRCIHSFSVCVYPLLFLFFFVESIRYSTKFKLWNEITFIE